MTEPTASEIRQLVETVKGEVVVRRSNRGGRTAAEHLISCLRCLYNQAVVDGLLMVTENTAARVPRPVRPPSARRALPFDLDVDQCLIRLREEAGSVRWLPVSSALMSQLERLLRTRRGKLISYRRYDSCGCGSAGTSRR